MRFKAVLFAVFCLTIAAMAQKTETGNSGNNGNNGGSTATESTPVSSNPGAATFNAPRGGSLWDQVTGTTTNGVPAQDFETGFDAYDSMGADDFEVPAGYAWNIQSFDFITTIGDANALNTVTVQILEDNNGAPGAILYDFEGTTVTINEVDPNVFQVTADIPDTELSAGIYWVALAGELDFAAGGQIFWSNDGGPPNTLNEGYWSNPNDGFGSGCTGWTAITTCGVGGGFSELQFRVNGTEGPACSIDNVMVGAEDQNGDVAVTVYGHCDDFDLYADTPGGLVLVGEGLAVDGVETFTVAFETDAIYFASADGGASAVGGVTSTRTVPTLGEWGMIMFLAGLAMAALYFVRKQRLTA